MNRRKKAIFWKIDLRVKPGDVVIYENSYYLNKNGINSNPLNDSNWLYLGDVSKKVLDFTFSDDGTLGNGFNKPLDNVRNLSFSGDDFEYELNEDEGVLLIKQNQNKQQEDNSHDYSIDEIQVGRFIYINDNGDKVSKPKYRKVFKGLSNNAGIFNIDISNLNIDNIVGEIKSIMYDGDSFHKGNFIEITDFENYYIYGATKVSKVDNLLNVQSYSVTSGVISFISGLEIIVTLEYTKTTDPETLIN